MAELVPVCDKLADIGTDHGFLPLYLLETEKISRAICADINAMPLESAKRNFAAAELSSRADFRLGNGMEVIGEGEADVAVMAGMGGETIAELIAADRSKTPLFVLQPMSKSERLRTWLSENGWGIEKWNLVPDAGRLYEVLLVSKNAPTAKSPYLRFGSPDAIDRSLYLRYIDEKLSGCQKALRGLRAAAEPDSDRISENENDIETLTRIKNNL